MKKLISIILTACICLSLLGGISFAGATGTATEVIMYSFKSSSAAYLDKISIADRGWSYLDGYAASGKVQSATSYLKISTTAAEQFLALNISVPNEGDYSVSLVSCLATSGSNPAGGYGDVYIIPEEKSKITADDLTDSYKIFTDVRYFSTTGSSGSLTMKSPTSVHLKAGINTLVFKVSSKSTATSNTNQYRMFPDSMTITPVIAGKGVYLLNSSSVDKTDYSDTWDAELAATGLFESTIVPLKEYGNHGFKYLDADNVTYETARNTNHRALHFHNDYLRVLSEGGTGVEGNAEFDNGTAKLALNFEKPSKNPNFYSLTVNTYSNSSNAAKAEFYASYNDDVLTDVDDCVVGKNKIGDTYNIEPNGSYILDELIYSDGVQDLAVAFNTGENGTLSLTSLALDPVDVSSITLDAPTTLEVGKTSTVKVMAEEKSVVDSFVTYTVTEETDVIDIAPDGTVTAKAVGTATITATVGEFSATATIEVTEAPVEEPEDEPEEAPTEINYGVFVNDANCASAVTANGTKLSETTDGFATGELAPGTTLTATAEDNVPGYKFRYWVLGSAATGRYYSSNNTVTVTPYANIALTAIYTADSIGNVVDLFNYNGEFLQTLTNLSDLANVQPTMIGHTFANKWLLADKTELKTDTVLTTPVTQAVAQYTKNSGYEAKNVNEDSTYGWTRNGKLVTYDEDYTFLTWLNEVGTIEENTEEITDEVPLVVLEEKNGVYMIEYDKGEYEIVEAGILFGKNADVDVNSAYSKATVKNIKPHGQFTASPIANATASLQSNARGYVMYRDKNDNNKIKVIYSK